MDRKQVLRDVAVEILDFEGQRAVEEKLACDEERLATLYILGGLDARVANKKIKDERARELYKILAVNPEVASGLRARNNSF